MDADARRYFGAGCDRLHHGRTCHAPQRSQLAPPTRQVANESVALDSMGLNVVSRALALGFDTIQFTGRADMLCGNRAVEIVALRGNGTLACSGNVTYRRGWRASEECRCVEGPLHPPTKADFRRCLSVWPLPPGTHHLWPLPGTRLRQSAQQLVQQRARLCAGRARGRARAAGRAVRPQVTSHDARLAWRCYDTHILDVGLARYVAGERYCTRHEQLKRVAGGELLS
eukprot:7297675-Prymnesium_polylepis.1